VLGLFVLLQVAGTTGLWALRRATAQLRQRSSGSSGGAGGGGARVTQPPPPLGPKDTAAAAAADESLPPPYGDGKAANRDIRVWARRDRKGSLNDGRIQNPSNPFGIVPLSRFVPRGF
jgi:hypothetical protein